MDVTGIDKIKEAVLDKARAEAQDIIEHAEAAAREETEKARRQNERRFEENKRRVIEDARKESARILAQASLKERQELLTAKSAIIDEIIARVKGELSQGAIDKGPFLSLIKESVDTLGLDKVRIYVSPRDMSMAQEIITEDNELEDRIIEVNELNCMGGVLAEDISGMVSIDNTFETRLEMLMPKILPDIGKAVFGN